MPRRKEDRTYRIRQVPPHLDKLGLVSFLAGLDGEGFGPADNIRIYSLAASLQVQGTSDHSYEKTGTIAFKSVPTRFNNDLTEWTVPTRDLGLQKNIIFDIHFHGFTPLNDAISNLHSIDCIAISGLDSHPFGSWKKKSVAGQYSNFMWLRDQLPTDVPSIRTIIYGYDTTLVMSESFQDLNDLARSFVGRLESISQSLNPGRSLVFIAHSMGGLLLKRALVKMNSGSSSSRVRSLLSSVRQVILFGVPNRGMENSHFRPMVAGRPNAQLVEMLSVESTYLSELDRAFFDVARSKRIRLISVYETQRSPSMQLRSGEWSRDGPPIVLVDKDSAIQEGSAEEDIFPIDCDHSSLVKFAEDSEEYWVIVKKLREIKGELSVRPDKRQPRYRDRKQEEGSCILM